MTAQVGNQKWINEENTPLWVKTIFSQKKLNKKYSFSYNLNPFYQRGDFDGDGKIDIAILVTEIKTGKRGIAVCHQGTYQVYFLGAGTLIGNGGDDFKWMDVWSVFPKDQVNIEGGESATPQLIGEALYVEKSESAGGIIYWNGKKYLWYQHGD
jgi:hypothetical protein